MDLNDWKENGRPKQMGDQDKSLNDGVSADSQQDVDFWDRDRNNTVENEVEVAAETVEIQEAVEGQEAVEHSEMPSEKSEKESQTQKKTRRRRKKIKPRI